MTVGVRKLVVVLALAALLVAGLSACGGGDDSTSTTAEAPTSTQQEEKAGSNGSSGAKDGDGKPAGQAKGGKSGSESKSKPVKVDAVPLQVSGGGSAPFRVRGGDNSIQEYGSESDETELQEAAEVLHAFFVARAEGDWATACSYFSENMVKQLEQLAEQSEQLRGRGCPPILDALTAPLSGAARTTMTEVDAASLRREDDRAFLIFRGAGGVDSFISMTEEDGTWKVGAFAATTLP